MGKLIDGVWHANDRDLTGDEEGHFRRAAATFRDWVKKGDAKHPAEPGRYHLYVAYACPWAHRTLIYRALKGLEAITVSVAKPEMLENGWELEDDPVNGTRFLHEVYTRADPSFTGRVTVPVLWDKVAGTIVNNESAEIIRMFDEELGRTGPDLRPVPLRDEIDEVNARVYDTINNGVYKSGFASSQRAYDKAVGELFESLDWLEARLDGSRWLVGDRMTEADIRLFTTLYRFDPVYFVHFKCSRRQIQDYPRLWALTRRIYQIPAVKATCHLEAIRRHYYYSHAQINPYRIVPIPPDIDYDAEVVEDRA
ncbi:MAG: glutathione S-transferase family protein [Sandaracinaceae bacterium]